MCANESHDEQPFDNALIEALSESQRLGFLGERSVRDAAQHARSFVHALDGVDGRVVDIGAGGGLPGLVLAHDRPDLDLLLVDRRGKRTDFLRRMVHRLGWRDRVTVREADVRDVARDQAGSFDAVVARGFGPPEVTIAYAAQLMGPGGRAIVSEPPTGDRWDATLIADLGLRRLDRADKRVVIFGRRAS